MPDESKPKYTPDIPQAKDKFNASQSQMLTNFATLYDTFGQNHIALDAASGAGNHTVIQLAEQTAQLQTNAGEISVYAKEITGQTDQLFLRYQGNQTEFRYTNYQVYKPPDIFESNRIQLQYFTTLPGNIIIYFGRVSGSGTTFLMELYPYVSTNIIAANFGAEGTAPASSPDITLVRSNAGIYTQIRLNTPGLTNLPSYSYFVMANI